MHSDSKGLQNHNTTLKIHFLCRYLPRQIYHLAISQEAVSHQPCEVLASLGKPFEYQGLGPVEG